MPDNPTDDGTWMDPISAAAVTTLISGVVKWISGATFTRTPHLSWNQANDVANLLKVAMAKAFAAKHGASLTTVSKYHNAFVSYLDVQSGQKSWEREAHTIATDSIADAQNYLFGGQQNAEHYLDIMMWRWVMYVAMNYDSRRPNEFKSELQHRTITVFDFDPLVTTTDQKTIADNANNFLQGLFTGISKLFGGNTTPNNTQPVSTAAMNTIQIVLAFGMLIGIIFFVNKKMK